MTAIIRRSHTLFITLLLAIALLTTQTKALSIISTGTDHFESTNLVVSIDACSRLGYSSNKATYIDVYSMAVFAENLNQSRPLLGARFIATDGNETHYTEKQDYFPDFVYPGESIYHERLWETVDTNCRYEKNGNASLAVVSMGVFTGVEAGAGHTFHCLSDYSFLINTAG